VIGFPCQITRGAALNVPLMTALRLLAASILFATALTAADKPNLIFILSDDLAQGDLGCYGQKLIQTPNLDRMAQEGTRYLQGYCGTSVCAPSRSTLMTGLHTGHCPIRANREIQPEGQKPLPAGTITVAKILKNAGYATACCGKWGMGMFDTTGSPLKLGFDHFFGYNCQRHAHSYFPAYLYNDDQRIELPGNDGKGVGKTYAQNLIADETLKFVRKQGPAVLPLLFHHAAARPLRDRRSGRVQGQTVDGNTEKLRRHGHPARHRCRPPAFAAQGAQNRRANPRHARG
jgi:arylsulfatase A-like enzyme